MTTTKTDQIFIPENDGWTLPGFFSATTNLHPDIRFTYRPFTPAERAIAMERIHSARSSEEAAQIISRTLASRIKSWDVVRDGKPVPLATEAFARMRYPVWDRFYQVVISQSGVSDTDPNWNDEDRRLDSDAKFESLLTGKTVTQAALETLEKN